MKPDEIKANFKATGGCVNFEALEYINELEADNERLNKKVEELSEVLSDSIKIKVKETKSEAIKEFAVRLKEAKANSTMDIRIYTTEMIDNLVKEMVGGNNGI